MSTTHSSQPQKHTAEYSDATGKQRNVASLGNNDTIEYLDKNAHSKYGAANAFILCSPDSSGEYENKDLPSFLTTEMFGIPEGGVINVVDFSDALPKETVNPAEALKLAIADLIIKVNNS